MLYPVATLLLLTHVIYAKLSPSDVKSGAWGLKSIYQPAGMIKVPDFNGKGTHIYVVGSGVDSTHEEIAGRVEKEGYVQRYIVDPINSSCVPDPETLPKCDPYGTGSAAAGIAAGATFGVASLARIVDVTVQDGAGKFTLDRAIAGIEWAVEDMQAKGRRGVLLITANIPSSVDFDGVLIQAAEAGMIVVLPAGDDSTDMCRVRPLDVAFGHAKNIITVASVDPMHCRNVESNFGACVDIFAPGFDIQSISTRHITGSKRFRGTFTSAAFVAGAAAGMLEVSNGDPDMAVSSLYRFASREKIADAGEGSHTLSLSLPIMSAESPPSPDPVAPRSRRGALAAVSAALATKASAGVANRRSRDVARRNQVQSGCETLLSKKKCKNSRGNRCKWTDMYNCVKKLDVKMVDLTGIVRLPAASAKRRCEQQGKRVCSDLTHLAQKKPEMSKQFRWVWARSKNESIHNCSAFPNKEPALELKKGKITCMRAKRALVFMCCDGDAAVRQEAIDHCAAHQTVPECGNSKGNTCKWVDQFKCMVGIQVRLDPLKTNAKGSYELATERCEREGLRLCNDKTQLAQQFKKDYTPHVVWVRTLEGTKSICPEGEIPAVNQKRQKVFCYPPAKKLGVVCCDNNEPEY